VQELTRVNATQDEDSGNRWLMTKLLDERPCVMVTFSKIIRGLSAHEN
jgi:hypothetical protein